MTVRNRLDRGLHIDTNHTPHRWLTFIIYLCTTPPVDGGHTVFPLAQHGTTAAPKMQTLSSAAHFLVDSGCQHTSHATRHAAKGSSSIQRASQCILGHAENIADEATKCLQSGVYFDPCGVGLAVPAVQGSCVAFYSRSPETGVIDPMSFHGGAALTGYDAAKWTLQRFREAPVDETATGEIEAFVAQIGILKC